MSEENQTASRRRKRVVKDKPAKPELTPAEIAAKIEKRSLTRRLKLGRFLLARCQVHAHSWCSVHSKRRLVKGAVACKNGSWLDLLKNMVSDSTSKVPDKCDICTSYLQQSDFNWEQFKDDLKKGLAAPQRNHDLDSGNEEVVQVPDSPIKSEDRDIDASAPSAEKPKETQNRKNTKQFDAIKAVNENEFLELLDKGSHKKALPVKCLLCRRRNGQAAIFDLVSHNRRKYYDQHVDSPTHQKLLQAHLQAQDPTKQWVKQEVVACEGFCPEKAPSSKVFSMMAEFKIWSVYNGLEHSGTLNEASGARHAYNLNMVDQQHSVRHHSCEKTAAPVLTLSWGQGHPMCHRCRSLGNDRSVLRMVARFYVKHVAARVPAENPVCEV